ncbi:MAG: coenzyme F420-0:L-glutamate ligase [Candidatus Woesearchaeota archaeon]
MKNGYTIPGQSCGASSIGVTAPVLKSGDSIEDFVIDALKPFYESGALGDDDIVCVTESVVARSQQNYVTLDNIAEDFARKLQISADDNVGIVFPILSRNRYSMMLHAFARAAPNLTLLLGYPRDEQGNQLMSEEQIKQLGKNPYTDLIDMAEYDSLAPKFLHPFTHMNYVDYYREIMAQEGTNGAVYLGNDPLQIMRFANKILVSNIPGRFSDKEKLKEAGAQHVITLDEVCNEPSTAHGYNPQFGLLGSNISNPAIEQLKLFPRDGDLYAKRIQDRLLAEYGKKMHVIIYGDGAYKDPTSQVWELADPEVAAGCTPEIKDRVPKELKFKYLADKYTAQGMSHEQIAAQIRHDIDHKEADLEKRFESQGTTPRYVRNLIGSLADLTSGSGDRGTPIVLVKNYFTNWTS